MSDIHKCSREKEVDSCLSEIKEVREKENKLEMAIQSIKDKLDAHVKAINKKLDVFIEAVNVSCAKKEADIEELKEDVSKLKTTLTMGKWFSIGALGMLFILNGAEWLPLIIKLFTKGTL